MKSIFFPTNSHLKINSFFARKNQKNNNFRQEKNQTNQCRFQGFKGIFQDTSPCHHHFLLTSEVLDFASCTTQLYTWNYSKLLFQGKVGRACGTRKGGITFFKAFLFQGDVHAVGKRATAPASSFSRTAFLASFSRCKNCRQNLVLFQEASFSRLGLANLFQGYGMDCTPKNDPFSRINVSGCYVHPFSCEQEVKQNPILRCQFSTKLG